MDGLDQQRALEEALGSVTRDEDLDTVLGRLAGLVVSALGYQSAAIYLVDVGGHVLERVAAAGESISHPAELHLDDADLAARAAREKRALADGSERAVPLLLAGEGGALGGVVVAHGTSEPGTTDALPALAGVSALAVERHRLRSALDERSEWFERLSEVDPLTGLANRRTLLRALGLEVARSSRQGTTFQVVAFDLVGFGAVVDRLGPGAGETALRRIAAMLTGKVRLIDTVGRMGAAEFVVIAPGATGSALEERIVAAAAQETLEDGTPLPLRAGHASYPDDGASAEELLRVAFDRLRAGVP